MSGNVDFQADTKTAEAARARRFAEREAENRIADEEARADAALEAARRGNRNFVQVYEAGFMRMRRLLRECPGALELWLYLAQHIDADTGGVVASQAHLAEVLGVSEKSIRRWSALMEKQNALFRLRVGSGVYMYALNEKEVWKSWDKGKEYSVFKTRTLVKTSDKRNSLIHRKITTLLKAGDGAKERAGEGDMDARA